MELYAASLWPITKSCTWCNEGTWSHGVATQAACQAMAIKASSNHYTYKPGAKQCEINPHDTNGCSSYSSGYGSSCNGNVHKQPSTGTPLRKRTRHGRHHTRRHARQDSTHTRTHASCEPKWLFEFPFQPLPMDITATAARSSIQRL